MDNLIVAQIFSQQSVWLGLLLCDKHYALNQNETQNHYWLNASDSFQQINFSFFLYTSDRLYTTGDV